MGLIKETVLVYHPNRVDDNVFFSKIMDGTSEITFQIPKTKIYFDKEKEKCKILIDERSISEIESVSKEVIRITSEKSIEFFGKEIDIDSCSSLYRNAVCEENLLNCFYSSDTYFFDRKTELNVSEIPDDTTGIVLLKGDVIVYTKTAFYIRWEIQQMKVKTEKSSKHSEVLLTEYSIIDVPGDEINETEKIAKKLKEISLF